VLRVPEYNNFNRACLAEIAASTDAEAG